MRGSKGSIAPAPVHDRHTFLRNLSTDSSITGRLASYVGDLRLRRALSTFWRSARPRKAKPATRAGFISVLIFRWFGDHRKRKVKLNFQLRENQAACQAETAFPLTGELCADFTALSDGKPRITRSYHHGTLCESGGFWQPCQLRGNEFPRLVCNFFWRTRTPRIAKPR